MKNGAYLLQIAPKHYTGKRYRKKYAYVHHVVWWENTKQNVPEGWTIHHKDGDKHNNTFTNLALLERGLHTRLHNSNRKKATVHGTLTAWTHHKCRCIDCRNCYNTYMREYKRVHRSAKGKRSDC